MRFLGFPFSSSSTISASLSGEIGGWPGAGRSLRGQRWPSDSSISTCHSAHQLHAQEHIYRSQSPTLHLKQHTQRDRQRNAPTNSTEPVTMEVENRRSSVTDVKLSSRATIVSDTSPDRATVQTPDAAINCSMSTPRQPPLTQQLGQLNVPATRPLPRWTVGTAWTARASQEAPPQRYQHLAALPPPSASWSLRC